MDKTTIYRYENEVFVLDQFDKNPLKEAQRKFKGVEPEVITVLSEDKDSMLESIGKEIELKEKYNRTIKVKDTFAGKIAEKAGLILNKEQLEETKDEINEEKRKQEKLKNKVTIEETNIVMEEKVASVERKEREISDKNEILPVALKLELNEKHQMYHYETLSFDEAGKDVFIVDSRELKAFLKLKNDIVKSDKRLERAFENEMRGLGYSPGPDREYTIENARHDRLIEEATRKKLTNQIDQILNKTVVTETTNGEDGFDYKLYRNDPTVKKEGAKYERVMLQDTAKYTSSMRYIANFEKEMVSSERRRLETLGDQQLSKRYESDIEYYHERITEYKTDIKEIVERAKTFISEKETSINKEKEL